jgi:hypothetical protein
MGLLIVALSFGVGNTFRLTMYSGCILDIEETELVRNCCFLALRDVPSSGYVHVFDTWIDTTG